MEYVKTFALLIVFIILSVGCVLNIIRHWKENKETRAETKKAKKQEKQEKKLRRRARLMGIKLDDNKPEPKKIVREYDLDPNEEYDEAYDEIDG